MRLNLLLLVSLFASLLVEGQDLSGTWEGSGSGAPYLKIVLARCGNRYYGYTFDQAGSTYCRTDFSADYDSVRQRLKGSSSRFIVNNWGHVLCNYTFTFIQRGGRDALDGSIRPKGAAVVLTLGLGASTYLRRTSTEVDSTDYMRRSLEACKVSPDTAKAKPVPAPATAPAPPPVAVAPPAAAPAIPDSIVELRKIRYERRSDTVETIHTTSRRLLVRVFDNGLPDGDIVSILYNDRVIADHHTVTVKPLEYVIELAEGVTTHTITVIAHNLGSVAPNTASVIVEAGDQKYHIRASTDLQRNAVIRIYYKP